MVSEPDQVVVRPERLEAAARALSAAAARWDARLQAIKRLAQAEHRQQNGESPR